MHMGFDWNGKADDEKNKNELNISPYIIHNNNKQPNTNSNFESEEKNTRRDKAKKKEWGTIEMWEGAARKGREGEGNK